MNERIREDERTIELWAINAIFPELVTDPQKPFCAQLQIPVVPLSPLTVLFKPPKAPFASPETSAYHQDFPQITHDQMHNVLREPADSNLHCQTFKNLPSLLLDIVLPDGYPDTKQPEFKLSTNPSWLPRCVLAKLESDGLALWKNSGCSQMVYNYIDYLQQEAESGFGFSSKQPLPELNYELRSSLLAFDRKSSREKFEQQTFHCGICLEPKNGSQCYLLRRCQHVFCVRCLQEFYMNCINEGDITQICCMDPTCAEDRKRMRKKQESLHPTELLDMAIPRSTVQRYVDLKIKKKLESDRSTIYCPRSFCQSPARSQKHHTLNDIFSFSDSDAEPETYPKTKEGLAVAIETNPSTKPEIPALPIDRLAICSMCDFAFCRVCSRSWHGELVRNCQPRDPAELTKEERASYEYIRKNTTRCPTCGSPVQKTMGCNHMACFLCRTHFCYLCSSWLKPDNPYQHFNSKRTECYGRLWELEGADDGLDNDHRAFEAAAVVDGVANAV